MESWVLGTELLCGEGAKVGRRAEAPSSAEVGGSFPLLAMRKCPLGLRACGDHAWGDLEAWFLVFGGRPPGVGSACRPLGWASALHESLGFVRAVLAA